MALFPYNTETTGSPGMVSRTESPARERQWHSFQRFSRHSLIAGSDRFPSAGRQSARVWRTGREWRKKKGRTKWGGGTGHRLARAWMTTFSRVVVVVVAAARVGGIFGLGFVSEGCRGKIAVFLDRKEGNNPPS